jgi:predicted HD phosphohydrolase
MASDIGKMHFRRMDEGTDADFAVLARVHEENIRKLPDLLIGLLTNLKADAAYPVDRLQHSLQAATRALRDGRDEEYVVCALLHDIGESLGPFNHGEVVGAVLWPFVSEANRWMLEHHPVFQVYFYGHHLKIDENAREQYRGSPHFDRTAEFCALYDEVSFDAGYASEPMATSSRWCVASFARTGRRPGRS